MFWYIILFALFVSCAWLLYGPSENSGGDATLFIKAAQPGRQQSKKPKFDRVNCNIYNTPGKQVLILYGTAYGFAERLGRKLYLKLRTVNDIQPRLVNMCDATNYIDWTQETCILYIVSTAGDGVAPSDARVFIDNLVNTIDATQYKHIQYATLALGDTNYPQYCAAGKLVHQRLSELGAQSLLPVQLVDKEDYTIIDTWFDRITQTIQVMSIPTKQDYLATKQLVNTQSTYNRNNPFAARVSEKYLLTELGRSDDKEIVHVEIDLTGSDLSYTEGDAIGIMPYNSDIDVQYVLQAISKTGTENVSIDGYDHVRTLNDALTQCLDLRMIPDTLLQQLSTAAQNTELKQLQQAAANRDQYIVGKEVIEVLQQFPTAASKVPVQSLCDSLRPLQPRYYSISSSPLVKSNIAAVTAGVIRYSMPNRQGTGVCTTYLSDRVNVSNTVNVFISSNHDFRLPADPSTPIIMIGPGTGIAPFRAFIQNRVATQCTGVNRLYFGCRHAARDYTYKNELEQWVQQGHLQLRTAFSRDQTAKIYVQHLIEQDAELIYQLLVKQKAHLYVCGDGAAMAKDVHTALLNILQQHAKQSLTQAEMYLTDLTKQGRYQKDVWIT